MKSYIFALSAVAIALAIPHSLAQTAVLENTAFSTDMRASYSQAQPASSVVLQLPALRHKPTAHSRL